MTELRVACWNLNGATGRRAEALGSLLRREGGEVGLALLQEAVPAGLEVFRAAAGLDWAVSTEELAPDLLRVRSRDGKDAARRPRAVALAGVGPALRSPVVFPDVPLPEKVLAGWVDVGGQPVTVVSYHAPTGVQHKEKKPAQAVRLADWLQDLAGPVMFGGDFNTPKTDHPDHAQIRTHWHSGDRHLEGATGDDVLVGPNECHALRDVLRSWLEDHPDEMAAIRAKVRTARSKSRTEPVHSRTRAGTTRSGRRRTSL